MSFLSRCSPLLGSLSNAMRFILKPKRSTGAGYNLHRSNRAKQGLYHGKDIRSGHSISHSHVRSKRKWFPNVINKRVWSYALDDWVQFKMTTTALKAIDSYGGIDNYLLRLDEKSVSDSNYVTKMRFMIMAKLFHQGQLEQQIIRRMGFDKQPPPLLEMKQNEGDNEEAHLQ